MCATPGQSSLLPGLHLGAECPGHWPDFGQGVVAALGHSSLLPGVHFVGWQPKNSGSFRNST